MTKTNPPIVIHVQKVRKAILAEVLPYFKAHFGKEEDEPDAETMSEEALKEFDRKFVEKDPKILLEIVAVRFMPSGSQKMLQRPVIGHHLLTNNVYYRLHII